MGVAYGYSGYQMIEQARTMVAAGELGEIRLVNLQFAHGFHSAPVEEQNPTVRWRVDPTVAGLSYVLGDLATHPIFLAGHILPDLHITRLMCARQSFVKSRAPLEDNAVVLMEYDPGAFGQLWTSAVNAGSTHSQKVRIVGESASIEWWDEHPNQLRFEVQDQPVRILERNMSYLHAAATGSTPATPRAFSRRGPTSTTASPKRWRRPTLATQSPCHGCATQTSPLASRASAGSRTAFARPISAASGSTRLTARHFGKAFQIG